MTTRERRAGDRALAAVLAVYIVGYAALAVTGTYVFIYKTALVPALILYALASGDGRRFIADWFPALGAIVLFDACRGAVGVFAQTGLRPVFVHYPIAADAWLTGSDSVNAVVQHAMRSTALDRVMVTVHGAHFLLFALIGLVLWHVRREAFGIYRNALVAVLYTGLLIYFVAPTAPPWLASERGVLVPVVRIVMETYTTRIPELVEAFDTNSVAAMPSLHIALPAIAALVLARTFGRLAAALAGGYVVMVGFALVYLGEHYLIDLIAGVLVAAVVFRAVQRPRRVSVMGTTRGALLGLVLIAAAFAVSALSSRP